MESIHVSYDCAFPPLKSRPGGPQFFFRVPGLSWLHRIKGPQIPNLIQTDTAFTPSDTQAVISNEHHINCVLLAPLASRWSDNASFFLNKEESHRFILSLSCVVR